MSTFTNTLLDKLLLQLAEHAKKLAIPKIKLIEKAPQIYWGQLNSADKERFARKVGNILK